MGALGMFMLQKIAARTCKECGAKDSFKVERVNTDSMEEFAKETEIVMKCSKCGHEEYDPLEHCSSHAEDTIQMYTLRYVKSVEKFAKNISTGV